jgi:hypothetical protein
VRRARLKFKGKVARVKTLRSRLASNERKTLLPPRRSTALSLAYASGFLIVAARRTFFGKARQDFAISLVANWRVARLERENNSEGRTSQERWMIATTNTFIPESPTAACEDCELPASADYCVAWRFRMNGSWHREYFENRFEAHRRYLQLVSRASEICLYVPAEGC